MEVSPQLLLDDLYACQPMIEQVAVEDMQYIFVTKPKSHTYLYKEILAREKLGQIKEVSHNQWTGKKHRRFSYRYANRVTLKDGENSVAVNWVELIISDAKGKLTFRTSFITSYLITDENVRELVEAGRCRWKIENENFNTLKTKGYHFEHNFGHGNRYLSQILLSLNNLAFLFHTVMELLDENCAWLRKTLPRRDTFFQHIATLTQYHRFASWESLLKFMIRALKAPGLPLSFSQSTAKFSA